MIFQVFSKDIFNLLFKLIDQYAEKQVLNGTEVEENQKSISEEEEEDEEEENETKKLQEEADKLTDVASPLSG